MCVLVCLCYIESYVSRLREVRVHAGGLSRVATAVGPRAFRRDSWRRCACTRGPCMCTEAATLGVWLPHPRARRKRGNGEPVHLPAMAPTPPGSPRCTMNIQTHCRLRPTIGHTLAKQAAKARSPHSGGCMKFLHGPARRLRGSAPTSPPRPGSGSR